MSKYRKIADRILKVGKYPIRYKNILKTYSNETVWHSARIDNSLLEHNKKSGN